MKKSINWVALALYGSIGGLQAATSYIGHGIPQEYAPAIGISGGTLLAIKAYLSQGDKKKDTESQD